MLKPAQKVSLKPEAIRETKAEESDRGEPEDRLRANRRQMKSPSLFDYMRQMHAHHYAIYAYHRSFIFFPTTHYDLLIFNMNIIFSRKTLNNMTQHFS